MDELDLAVVVVNWNVKDLLIACLGSVLEAIEAAGLRGEVWVVDNASQDGSIEMLKAWFPSVHLIASPANLGFAGGNNLALKTLGFQVKSCELQVESCESPTPTFNSQLAISHLPRYVLLLNPDTLVREDALSKLVAFMEQNAGVGVCGPRLVYGDGSFQHSAYRFPSLAQTFLDFWPLNWRLTDSRLNGRYPRQLYEEGQPFSIDHPLGAAMLFRCEAIEQTGGLDLDYRMYVEEIDWCMRVKRAGWQIDCVPEAEIVHYEGQSTRHVRPQMIVALWRSRYILFQKHYSPLYRWAVRRLIRAGMRSKVRRARQAVRRGEMAEQDAGPIIKAYRQVIAM